MEIFSNIHGSGEKPAAGKALISEPFLFDANFKKTVILLCEHNDENGSLGFILNRKLDITLRDVMELETELIVPLYLGGPVQNNTLHYIHRDPDHTKDSITLGNGLYWGGNFEELVPKIENGTLDLGNYRFFLGYSGWSKGQLDNELAIKSWIVTLATQGLVFGETTNGTLWKNALNNMGGSYKLLANFPESPFLN